MNSNRLATAAAVLVATVALAPGDKPGPPPPPRACNKGDVTIEMRQPRVP